MPKWISNKAMLIYFLALLVVSILYMQYSLPWYYLLSGAASVFIFFYFSNKLSQQWSSTHINSSKNFEKKIFWISFLIRVVYVILIYVIFVNSETWGDEFGFEDADPVYYNALGAFVSNLVKEGNFNFYDEIERFNNGHIEFSDIGYGIYLGFLYAFTDDSIIIARIIKCIWSSITVILIYRLCTRNFGDSVGRMAAVFCMLWPNFWYYCGTHLKETEMVFLAVLFIEQADQMLRSRNFSIWKIMPLLLISAALFTFRTVLALLTILCLLFAIVLSSTKVIGWSKRILIGILAACLIGVTMGNSIKEQAQEIIEKVQSGEQKANMEWRSVRKDAAGHQNKFAKYAGAAVFAPLIFSIPFPTLVSPYEGQDVQKFLNGGNFIKNILSGFVILVMFMLLLSGKWKDHLLPVSFLIGYCIILAFSSFAQSERFHQPAMPFEMMFAAYGISQVLKGVPVYKNIGSKIKYKRWFNVWCVVMFVAAIAWNWFKLAGRGLI